MVLLSNAGNPVGDGILIQQLISGALLDVLNLASELDSVSREVVPNAVLELSELCAHMLGGSHLL